MGATCAPFIAESASNVAAATMGRPPFYYLLLLCAALISAQMPWEIPSLPEDSDEDINRSEFECFARCFNVVPSSTTKENNNTNWYQAYQFCRKYNMNLAPITTTVAENALSRLVTKHAQGGEGFWMGGTDIISEGKFYWVATAQDIDKGVVKLNSGSGRCVELKIVEKGDQEETEWVKGDCTLPKRFICSFPAACININGTST